MALTQIISPSTEVLSRNPILFKFLAADVFGNVYGTQSGVSAEAQTPNTYFVENDTLTVQWTEPDGTNHSVTFTAKDAPTLESEFQATSADPYATYLQSIADVIGSHPRISPFFNVTAEDNDPVFTLKIQSKFADSNWLVNWIAVASHTVTIVQSSSISPNNTPVNYAVNMEVFFEKVYDTGEFERIATIESHPDDNGHVYFDIQNIINNAQKDSRTTPDIPNFTDNSPYRCDNLRRFYVRFNEESGSPLAQSAWNTSNVIKSLFGGLPQIEHLNDEEFFPNVSAVNSWLTYYPNRKKIHETQPEHLAWYNWTGGDATVELQIDVYNNTSSAISNTITVFAGTVVKDGDTMIFPISYDALSLQQFAYTPEKFSVTLKYSSGTKTGANARTYYLDCTYQENARFIFYINGFGAPECLMLRGHYEKNLQVSREITERIITPDTSPLARQVEQYGYDYQHPITYRSGYLSDKEVDALQELIIYNDAYEVSEDERRSIHILTNQFSIENTFTFLNQIAFTAILGINDKNYKNDFATDGVVYVIGDPNANEIIGDGTNVIGY